MRYYESQVGRSLVETCLSTMLMQEECEKSYLESGHDPHIKVIDFE